MLTVEQAAGLPPTIQDGIGPGSALRMGVNGIQYICSASFLLRDPTTMVYYLSTAGHCLVRDTSDPAVVTGHDHPEKVKNRFDICVAGCINNGLGLGTFVSLVPSGDYHPVAYAVSGGIGMDFGLIEIPAELHDLLRPELPQWGGPTGLATTGNIGSLVAHYGHGTIVVPGVVGLVTRTPADQGRLGVLDGGIGADFGAAGHVTGGDSGSSASLAVVDPTGVARGTTALGVITHSIIYVGAPLFYGTTMVHGMNAATGHTQIPLELVPEGDSLPTQPPPPPAGEIEVRITSPGPSAKRTMGDTVTIKGTTAMGAGELPAGTRVEVTVDDPSFAAESLLEVEGVATWSAEWDSSGAAIGTRTIYARAIDGQEVVRASVNGTFQLRAPDQEPPPTPPEEPPETPEPEPTPTATATAAPAPSGAPHAAPSDAQAPGLPLAGLASCLVGIAFWIRRR